jgi:hypothetical protein
MAVSERTCQRCGGAASLRNLGGWLVTLCQQHLSDHHNNGDSTASS